MIDTDIKHINIRGRIEAGAGWCMHYYQFDFAKMKLHYELYHIVDMGFTWDEKQDCTSADEFRI